jgi:hypothetical protein
LYNNDARKDELQDILRKKAAVDSQLEATEMRWLEISESLEAAESALLRYS